MRRRQLAFALQAGHLPMVFLLLGEGFTLLREHTRMKGPMAIDALHLGAPGLHHQGQRPLIGSSVDDDLASIA